MKSVLTIIISVLLPLSLFSQSIETGIVKEYKGKNQKTVLAGVELMVKGAPSTISDDKGCFTLKFATLKAGEKIDYSEIYKDGYVIFNKEALDAWRISNDRRPFTIVMCKEADFRALKRKFYGIIEKSYYDEYVKQCKLAQATAAHSIELKQKLELLEKDYNEKMSNINTYVELFSRIDQSEMDSVEAKALEYMEAGQIGEAIKMYEELQLERQMKSQFSKWDAANEMRRAAQGMESDAQADLVMLVGKMQKQISLYEMGGSEYNSKRFDMMDNLISLLYRLRPVTGTQYNELLGTTLVKKTQNMHPAKALAIYREAAALPSVIGLCFLAKEYETFKPSEELVDSIRHFYYQALSLSDNKNDSISKLIKSALVKLPEGYYHHTDGNTYPYRSLPDNCAELMGQGPYYSTALAGEVRLPDVIMVNDTVRTVIGIGDFAYGRNPRLNKITLPEHCRYVGRDAFYRCDSLMVVVNAALDSVSAEEIAPAFPAKVQIEFSGVPQNIEWILQRCNKYSEDSTVNISPMVLALAQHYQMKGDNSSAGDFYEYLVDYSIKNHDLNGAKNYARMAAEADRRKSHLLMAKYLRAEGDLSAAIKEGEKGLDSDNLNSYNYVAYLNAEDSTENGFEKAHELIDKVISLAKTANDKAQLLDSKGEFYLMQGKEIEALEYLNRALETDPKYVSRTSSKLYTHFHPEVAGSGSAPDSVAVSVSIDMQRRRNLAISLMATEYLSQRIRHLNKNIYDAISIYVPNDVLTLSPDDADNFYANVEVLFCRALGVSARMLYSWSKKENIPFDNEWVGYMDIDEKHQFDEAAKYLATILIAINECANRLPCAQLYDGDVRRLQTYSRAIDNYKGTLSDSGRQMLDAILSGHDVEYFVENFNCSNDSLASFIKESIVWINSHKPDLHDEKTLIVDSDDANRYSVEIDSIISDINAQTAINRGRLRYWVDIVNRAAQLEHRLIPDIDNFRGVDYEELVSIGIIAMQVMIKNKTPEQLAKYNALYVATAVRWAMRNEMQIRYPWYHTVSSAIEISHELQKKYDSVGIDVEKAVVRTVVYQTLALMHYAGDDSDTPRSSVSTPQDSSALAELEQMWGAVVNARKDLPEEYIECYDAFFAKDADYSRFEEKFSPAIIHGMFNRLKEAINTAGLYGY